MKKKVISWIFIDWDETYELKDNEKIIGTHLSPPNSDEDVYAVVLVIENEGGLK